MKDKIKGYQKWWLLGIGIIILIIMFLFVFMNSNSNDNDYRKQAIVVLKDYKSGRNTNKEASEKLKSLSEKIGNEPEIDDKYKSSARLALKVELSMLSFKLFNEELSNSEIDNYIKEIEN